MLEHECDEQQELLSTEPDHPQGPMSGSSRREMDMFYTWEIYFFIILIKSQAIVFLLKMVSLFLYDRIFMSSHIGSCKKINIKLRKFCFSEKTLLRECAKNRRNLIFGLKF